MRKVDLNSDLGESYGRYSCGNDYEVIKRISSANIACGFHAGDPVVMEKTVKFALEEGVAIGAHPGLPDLMGFGRRRMEVSLEEVRAYLIYQVAALDGFVKTLGGKLQHVKPHGALYNMAASDYNLARAIAEAIYNLNSELVLVGLANSELIKAAEDVGLRTANEVFADRAYTSDGKLLSRREVGAVIEDGNVIAKRVLKMIVENKVETITGEEIEIKADTICVHGDTEAALALVEQINQTLDENDIEVAPFL
ncbi:UPF0271 protein [Orenia metallireducens]|jgi:UPF0271 protein|uniref:5-oxoprolinase subunit A n=1 Tax=Orenia metallireducens TaxID=1413210 RepID=A0A285I5A1_9FIRM|nr:5-oxoprolinase subunit PxpA [Orenia metallireducens]PRX19717.1 UPF0271 protein [Orenia metallireducens]SNY43114.1 UPF0271 protein [Orenia metallireducens]